MGLFKIKDIEEAARIILLDTYSDAESFSSKEICLSIRDGIKKINQLRPESRYVNNILQGHLLKDASGNGIDFELPASYDGISAFEENYVNMDDTWREPLVNYVVSIMYQKNDADTANAALAANYYNLFKDCIA